MRARVLDRKEAMVLKCAGRLTIRDRKSVERISNNITRSSHSQVVIDLSKLDYIDSAGSVFYCHCETGLSTEASGLQFPARPIPFAKSWTSRPLERCSKFARTQLLR